MQGNVVSEVAELFGQKIGQPFKVVGEDGSKALIKFDYSAGIKRFDGTYWNNAGYFLEHMVVGKIRPEMEQGTLGKKEWMKTLKEIKDYCQLTVCCGCMLYVNGRCALYGEPMEWNVDEIDSKSSYVEGRR